LKLILKPFVLSQSKPFGKMGKLGSLPILNVTNLCFE